MTRSRYEIVAQVAKSEMAKPHIYGKADCFFLPLANVDALQNSKLVKKYSGIYTIALGAKRAMKKRGFGSLGDVLKKHLEPIAPAMAVLGDVAIVDIGGVEHGAICLGEKFLTKTKNGPSHHSLSDVKTAFRV